MQYYSLNGQSPQVDFKEATILGQAPDGGLYFPATIPQFHKAFTRNMAGMSNADIAFSIIQPYVCNSIPEATLHGIVSETVNFDIPLVKVADDIFSLELFHGPTLAFKDIGARFMSRCLGYFVKERTEKVVVLVATSGDTGGAVANGFYKVPGVEVVILYPSGKVSKVQEQQLTTLGHNIHALEVAGSFDDCQQMVKQAFTDTALTQEVFLTSANSINVARWLPQQFYYAFACKQWADKETPPVICVPSGNFGNICAGLLAHHSGLPVQHFIAACNANNAVTDYLATEKYQPKKAVATLSNAMDVGNPSNFVRILEIFQQQLSNLSATLSSYSISDELTTATIKKVYQQYNYLTDPHGAVGFAALEQYLQQHPHSKGIFLETAHPVKFADVLEQAVGFTPELPAAVQQLAQRPKQATPIPTDYQTLRSFLLAV
jgi:threonine synthase